MAGQNVLFQKSYRIMDADGVAMYTGVVLSGDGQCKKPTADNEVPLGVVCADERLNNPFFSAAGDQTGKQVAVCLEGIAYLRLGGDVAAGNRIFLGAGGVGKTLPATPNSTPIQYNILGFAEKAGKAGDVIPVRIAFHVYTY